jgi:hypothetical protein
MAGFMTFQRCRLLHQQRKSERRVGSTLGAIGVIFALRQFWQTGADPGSVAQALSTWSDRGFVRPNFAQFDTD